MAWVDPPTFVDGDVLSAAQLNLLSDDVAYLLDRLVANNPSRLLFREQWLNKYGQLAGLVTWNFAIRHQARYLKMRVYGAWARTDSGPWANSDRLPRWRMTYNGTQVYPALPAVWEIMPLGNANTYYVWEVYADLDSLGLTVGEFYDVTFSHEEGTYPDPTPVHPENAVELTYLFEADET